MCSIRDHAAGMCCFGYHIKLEIQGKENIELKQRNCKYPVGKNSHKKEQQRPEERKVSTFHCEYLNLLRAGVTNNINDGPV